MTNNNNTTRLIVLSDGETFDVLSNCHTVDVPSDWDTEQIEVFLRLQKTLNDNAPTNEATYPA